MAVHDDDGWALPVAGLRILKRGRVAIRRIQLYGQRCSGTHAVTRLIEGNLGADAFTEAYGFKHWFVPRQMLFHEDVLVLVIARQPMEWAQALHRQPWHAHPTMRDRPFSEFIRTEWHSVWDGEVWGIDEHHPVRGTEMEHERDPSSGERFANAIAKRTAKLGQWTGIHRRAHNVALLDERAVRESPEAVVDALAAAMGREPARPFVPVDTYKGQGIRPFVPARYPEVEPADRDHIRSWLDPKVEGQFGFAV